VARAFLFDHQLPRCAITYHAVIIFSIFLLIAVAMIATVRDMGGQTILQLLHRAAGVAEENSRSALETTQNISSIVKPLRRKVSNSGGINPRKRPCGTT
jgi:hypothetical protein